MRYKLENVATPWLESYGEVAPNLDYSEKTMSGAVLERAGIEGEFPALSFMGKETSYKRLAEEIHKVGRCFYALGSGCWYAFPMYRRPCSACTG